MTSSISSVLLIGITCGFSAPYVGGMISQALDDAYVNTSDQFVISCRSSGKSTFVSLMGFNPCELASKATFPNWKCNFLDVVNRMDQTFVLNPVCDHPLITN